MRSFGVILGLLGAINGLTLPLPRDLQAERRDVAKSNTTTILGRYIVEFAKGSNAQTAAAELTAAGANVLKIFDSDVFIGATIESGIENIDSLQARATVGQAWQAKRYALAPVHAAKESDSYAQLATSANYSVHGMTGVDKLHAAGITGKGAVVAIVDTGVDYTHPALGGGFGPGFKVAGGYDYVGATNWPNEEKVPDSDPSDYIGHGTHVSGIIAGDLLGFKGVAPDATLLMYKVFGYLDYTDEDTLIEAFLAAYEAGADVITSSIGGDDGWTTNAWALVATRIVDQGVVVTISAGNSGESGPMDASSGSSGEHVVAVASVEATTISAPSFKATFSDSGETVKIGYLSNYVFSQYIDTMPIVPLHLDTTIINDACSPITGETRDLSNVIVLVRRGTCTFAVKQVNLEAIGVQYIMIYTTDTQPINIPLQGSYNSIIGMITAEAGEAIISSVKAGGTIDTDFAGPVAEIAVSVPNAPSVALGTVPGVANYFTSFGPTNELFIKPDVAAPGGDILSTYPGGKFVVMSGTSMACPYVAGIAALYIGQHGGRSTHGAGFAKTLAMKLISSGASLKFDDGTGSGLDYAGFKAPISQVGTGLINATKILSYDTELSFAKFHLNDTHHFQRYQSVDITNNGKAAITYTFALEDTAALFTINDDPNAPQTPRFPDNAEMMANPIKAAPAVTFPSGAFIVKPGETKTAKINFNSAPVGLDAKSIPVYSGKINIIGSNGEVLAVPYLGVAADVHNDVATVFPQVYYPPTMYKRFNRVSFVNNATFNLNRTKMDFPILVADIQYPTTEMRWDIFESTWKERDWVYPPVAGKNGFVGSATYYPYTNAYFNPDSGDDANIFYTFPRKNLARVPWNVQSTEIWWVGKLADGTQIPVGKYKMRIAGLMPFAEPTHADSWDILKWTDFEVLPLV